MDLGEGCHMCSSTELGMRLGIERKVRICSQFTCFPGLLNWCVHKESLLFLETGIMG